MSFITDPGGPTTRIPVQTGQRPRATLTSDDMAVMESINTLLVDGQAGRAAVAYGKLLDRLQARPFDDNAGRPEQRETHDVLVSMCQLAEEQLAVSRHILAALGSSNDSRSSIEIKTSTRGVDIASKAYEGSSTFGLVDLAVENYFATLDKVQARINGGTAGA